MKSRFFSTLTVFALALGLAGAVPAVAQTFSLDDLPGGGFGSAEDPYGIFGTSLGPSPSLAGFGLFDSDLLNAGPVIDVRSIPGAGLPGIWHLDAVSADHEPFSPGQWPWIRLRFSVDRHTGGILGSASGVQANRQQQPADIFQTEAVFPHPCTFNGNLGPAPFGGVLPSAGVGGSNTLVYNQAFFGLVPLVGPGVASPFAIGMGTHDNIDAFNELPGPQLDVTGDQISDFDTFYSVPPVEAAAIAVSPADIFDAPPGARLFAPFPPYAGAPSMGLDQMGGFDDVDALVVWDNGAPLGQHWGGPGAQAGVDCALFSLSPGSPSLAALAGAGWPVDPGTIFATDFSGRFAVFAFSGDLGLASPPGLPRNVDALEIAQD